MDMHIASQIALVRQNIDDALKRADRSDSVVIVGACKTMTRDIVKFIDDNALLNVLGENRVQELLDKCDIARHVKWHFIGALQTNKVKYIIDKVELIHSLDRDALAAEIDRQANKHGINAHCLVQVNMGEEESKSGYKPCELIAAIARIKETYPNISIDGVMAVMPIADQPTLIALYRQLGKLYKAACEKFDLHILSAGMTNDYTLAVEYARSNMVRIGRAIFGERYRSNEEDKK